MSYALEISDFLKDYYDSMTEEQQNSKYGRLLNYAYRDRLNEELDELDEKFRQSSSQFSEFINRVED